MPTTNILTTLAPTSVTSVEVAEDTYYVQVISDNEIVVYSETKTIDVDVGVYLFSGSLFNATGYTFVPTRQVSATNIQTAIEHLARQLNVSTTPSANPVEGDVFYDTNDNILQLRIDNAWQTLAASTINSMTRIEGGAF
jgi:hypothetical protein